MKRILLAFCCLFFSFVNGESRTRFTVLQWNIWQEGTQVPGGYDAIVNELVRLRPDFVTFSEVRNYRGTNFIARLIDSLKQRGETYYGFYSYDSGLISRHPISDSAVVYPERNDHGSIHRLVSEIGGRKIAVYTAHLDYLDDAYYNVRGYDGSTWREIPIPKTVEEVLARNARSRRDEAIAAFLRHAARDEEAGCAVVLGGDFNEPSHRDWTEQTRYLYDHHGLVIAWPQTSALERSGYVDVYRTLYPDPVTHPGFTFPADNPRVDPARLSWTPLADERERIDYLFCKGEGLSVVDCFIFGPAGTIAYGRRIPPFTRERFIEPLDVWPTDHKGLLATFELP